MTPTALPLSRRIRVADVRPSETEVNVVASPEEREALAAAYDLIAVDALEAHLDVAPDGRGGLAVSGTLKARVTYRCVVTLEPVPGTVNEAIAVRYSPAAPETITDVDVGGEDPPEPLDGGVADVGALVAEFLALGLDPYPRAPDAAVPHDDGTQSAAGEGPFAALAKLRPPDGNS